MTFGNSGLFSAAPQPLCGLFYFYNAQPVALQLLRVDARCTIKDLAASVSLSQVYHNESTVTVEGSYKFPVPARAAVCSFELVKQDGTKVVGVVQEKEEARETYDQAVQEGKMASLMEQDTPDTFSVTVGNLLPNEQVTVNLTYVTELTESDTNDSIRLHVPAHIGARYGQPPASKPPTSLLSLSANSSSTFFNLQTSIESVAPIKSISCPSHSVTTSLGPNSFLPNAASLPFSNYAQVTFTSDVTLDKDFVLSIESAGLDAPRCIAEIHPSQATAALSLSMVPRFSLPEIKEQEYIFLVDRSGSMGVGGFGFGSAQSAPPRIESAKKALIVLLRSLPKSGSTFNIFSFGSTHSAMWPNGSQSYSQSTLDEATQHVDSMQANFGGTEMKRALEGVFVSRQTTKPTSVFVLTDGDAWDLEGVNKAVESHVALAPSFAPLRVFVLGIGNSASTAMCDGIARTGNGISQFVVDGETFTGKTARLLKAARSPKLINVRLELPTSVQPEEKSKEEEDDFELVDDVEKLAIDAKEEEPVASAPTLSLFDDQVDPLASTESTSFPSIVPINLPPPPPVQQAPSQINTLYSGSRFSAYLLLTPSTLVPETLFLRAELASSGQALSLEIPVVVSKLPLDKTTSAPPPIHALAARKLIQDLEDGRHSLGIKNNDDLLKGTVKAHVVRLGKAYSLVSTHTSFVAVDESDVGTRRKEVRKTSLPPPPPRPQVATLFGGPPPPAPARRMLARAAVPPAQQQQHQFQAQQQASRVGAGLFGGVSLGSAPPGAPGSANVFGASAASYGAPPPPGGGALFGAAAARSTPPPPPSRAPAPVASASFGAAPSTSGGLFGATPLSSSTSLFGSSSTSAFSFGSSAFGSSAAPTMGGLFGSNRLETASFAAPAPPSTAAWGAPAPTSGPPSTPVDILDSLARLQSFSGSFSTSAITLCGVTFALVDLFTEVPDVNEDEEALATLIVLAYWEKKMLEQKEEWEGMADKAREFVAAKVGGEEQVQALMEKLKVCIL